MSTANGESVLGWQDTWRVALCIALCLAVTAWIRPLMLPDEGRYVSVAWEMLRSGDWLTPTLDGLPFFHKPPLFYWVTALALKVGGMHELTTRAAPLLGAWMGALSLYLFTRRWYGLAMARRAVAVLLALPLFYLGGQFSNLDMLVAGCIVATVLTLADAALRYEHALPYRTVLWGGYVLAALGVLAKGLIGFVLPAMVIGCWLLARRRWKSLGALISLPGLLCFALVAVPWFWLMQERFPEFMHYFFVVQHLQRFAHTGFNNAQPWWFYVALLAVSSLPVLLWSRAWLQRGYWCGKAQAAEGVQSSSTASPTQFAVRQLMAWSAACIVLFFSLPQSKLVGYVLPAVPALAWLIADASALVLTAHLWRRWLWRLSLGVGVVLSLTVIFILAQDQKHSARDLGRALYAQRQTGEPVFMVEQYLYDTPFYARLEAPIRVVGPWTPEVADNWRKELLDAAEFVPEQAQSILLKPAAWLPQMCTAPVSWVAGDATLAQTYPALAQSTAAYQGTLGTLWRVDLAQPGVAAAWGCGVRP